MNGQSCSTPKNVYLKKKYLQLASSSLPFYSGHLYNNFSSSNSYALCLSEHDPPGMLRTQITPLPDNVYTLSCALRVVVVGLQLSISLHAF